MRIALLCLMLATPAAAQLVEQGYNPAAPGIPSKDFNEELGLPYWAPGRGVVDHEAMTRRMLDVLEGQFSAFHTAASTLADDARAYCDGTLPEADVVESFRATWLAWAPLDSYQFGPLEQTGAALTVNFWPDKKGFIGRALRDLLSHPLEEQADPAVVASLSAGAQGLPAIEMLLFSDAPTCPAIVGIAANIEQLASDSYDGWFGDRGWAELARTAGPENPVYLAPQEFTKQMYTAAQFGLTRLADYRVARPLGGERVFPRRAEAWRSGFTNDILHAQLNGVGLLVERGFAGDVADPDRTWILRVVDQAHDRIDAVGMPLSEAVEDPDAVWRVEGLRTKLHYLKMQMDQDIGPQLGVDTGFSAADGD